MSTLVENDEGRAEGIGAPAGPLEKTVAFDFDKDEDRRQGVRHAVEA